MRQARSCLERQNQQGQEGCSTHPELVTQSVDVKFQGWDFAYASMVPMHPSGSYTNTDNHHSCHCVMLQMSFILPERCLLVLSFRPHSSPKTGHPPGSSHSFLQELLFLRTWPVFFFPSTQIEKTIRGCHHGAGIKTILMRFLSSMLACQLVLLLLFGLV